MGKATLVIMAAGIGSRFGGGIKQLEPVGPNGEIIMDYSIYDAVKAGFDKVVFVIRKDLEKDFREIIGNRIEKKVRVEYAFQELEDIPEKYKKRFLERTKPWGTGQAVLCCKEKVQEPFLVINADDYYGREAYEKAYQYLVSGEEQEGIINAAMVSFILKNTLSENGGVTRGICQIDEQNMLTGIKETHGIIKNGEYAIADGNIRIPLNANVSMNMWALHPDFFEILEIGFEEFLEKLNIKDLKSEYLLPTIMEKLLEKRTIAIKVLETNDKWFGVTYKEDKEGVVRAVKKLVELGHYIEI